MDEDIKFQDQIAMKVMEILLTRHNSGTHLSASDLDELEMYRIKRFATIAYKIAGEMRKARLASFK
jgi:hypothetical protein